MKQLISKRRLGRSGTPLCHQKKVRQMKTTAAWFGLGMVLASASAQAVEMKPVQGATIALGGATGVAYYTVEPNGFRVVATLAAVNGERPLRFEAVLTDGQELLVSVPGLVGTKASELVIARSGDRLSITDAPMIVAADNN
jgi:hypothetical protein